MAGTLADQRRQKPQMVLTLRAWQPLPKELRQFLDPLLEKAYAAQSPIYLIGGCVRDLLLGRESVDYDVVLEGTALPIARAAAKQYKAKLVSHPQFLTHTLNFKDGRHLDIATARTETPGRHPRTYLERRPGVRRED